ncbi:MAG: Asp-tRNA(Asn)/Glu-tRNA(Gln) amidotransferase subunit GatA, partial [Anaerolineales bacterium]|nr:Asp-tRNA(Asn)/Glu-tRNA(Gln) amidotransferase subunit GatA [Anaerolineales bacterium]
MMEHLCDQPAHEQVRRIKGGEISAIELLNSTLGRIDAIEGRQATTEPYTPNPTDLEKVHAFITVTRERAYAQAESVDRKIAAGEDPGPLAGVPLAVKDIFCVKDT